MNWVLNCTHLCLWCEEHSGCLRFGQIEHNVLLVSSLLAFGLLIVSTQMYSSCSILLVPSENPDELSYHCLTLRDGLTHRLIHNVTIFIIRDSCFDFGAIYG